MQALAPRTPAGVRLIARGDFRGWYPRLISNIPPGYAGGAQGAAAGVHGTQGINENIGGVRTTVRNEPFFQPFQGCPRPMSNIPPG